MPIALWIDIVKHCCHGGRFTWTSWTSDQDDSFIRSRGFEYWFSEKYIIRTRNNIRNHSHRNSNSFYRTRHIDTESCSTLWIWCIESPFIEFSSEKEFTNTLNIEASYNPIFIYRGDISHFIADIGMWFTDKMKIRYIHFDDFINEWNKFFIFHCIGLW